METKDELITLLVAYIKLLEKANSSHAAYLHTHGIHDAKEDIEEGIVLREKIKLISADVK